MNRQPRRDSLCEEEDDFASLVEATVDGDRQAARALFDAIAPIFLKAARRTLGRAHPDIDDFVQDASLRFFRSLPAFQGESHVRRYAYRIAVHASADWIRSRRALKRERVRGEIPESAATDENSLDIVRRRRIGQMLGRCLPKAQLDAFLFRNILGCTLDEVAVMTGVSTNTVRSRLRIARDHLRRELEKNPELVALLGENHE